MSQANSTTVSTKKKPDPKPYIKPIATLKNKREGLLKSPHFRTAIGYITIISLGLTAFYFAKRDITENRQRSMKIRQEIGKSPTGLSDRFKQTTESK